MSLKTRARTAATTHFGIKPEEEITEFEAGYQTGYAEAYADFAVVFTSEKEQTKRMIERQILKVDDVAKTVWQERLKALMSLGVRLNAALPREENAEESSPRQA